MKRAYTIPVTMLALGSILGGTAALADVEVNTCGQVYSGRGFLAGDLDCTGVDQWAVTIEGNGSLELRGFTISGGALTRRIVSCNKSCKIIGPGAIVGAWGSGVQARNKLKITNVDLTNNGHAVHARKAVVRDSTITDNNLGVVVDQSAKIVDSVIMGNGEGVIGRGWRRHRPKVYVIGSTVTGNKLYGVSACQVHSCTTGDKLIVKDSTISGNGLDPSCGVSTACADLASCRKPILLRTSTCDTSYACFSGIPGAPWGVCDLD